MQEMRFFTWLQRHTRRIIYSSHKTWGCDRALCAGIGRRPTERSSLSARRSVWEYSLCSPSLWYTEPPKEPQDSAACPGSVRLEGGKNSQRQSTNPLFAWARRNIIGPNHRLFSFIKSLTAGLDKREWKICRVQDAAKTLTHWRLLSKPDVDSTGQFW